MPVEEQDEQQENEERKQIAQTNQVIFFSGYYSSILSDLGYDAKSEGLIDTPTRVAKMLVEELDITNRMSHNDILLMMKTFNEEDYIADNDTMICMKNIAFSSWCEHHMLPFWGSFDIAYIPNKKIVGISKLIRLVRSTTQGLTLQERSTNNTAEYLYTSIEAAGVLVISNAVHSCMIARGVRGVNESLTVSAVRGIIKTSDKARNEALRLLGY